MTQSRAEFLNPAEELLLLRIARESMSTYVLHGKRISLDDFDLTPALRARQGAFVTLQQGTELRGCIGHTTNLDTLAGAVLDNAINAAVRDPRFPPVRPEELSEIRIEVSALAPGSTPTSPFIPVSDLREIEIGRDGLYLDQVGARGGGLLLPQVAVERQWDIHQFLEGVCAKAGAPPNAWQDPDSQLYRFSAQVFAEDQHVT